MTERIDNLGNELGFDPHKEKIDLNPDTNSLYIFVEGQPLIPITKEVAKRVKDYQERYPIYHQHRKISPYGAYIDISREDEESDREERH